MTKKNISFKQQFDRLGEISKLISDFENLDIDTLIPLIEEANSIYKICAERLDNIDKALDSTLLSDKK